MKERDQLSREIFDSGDKLVGWFVGLAFFGLLLTVGVFNGEPLSRVISGLALAALLAAAGRLLIRMMLIKLPIIIIDESGLFDRRISPDRIPWSIAVSIDPIRARYGNLAGARLTIRREQLQRLKLEPLSSAFRWLQSRKELGGLGITAFCVDLSGDELYNLCAAYSRLHHVQDDPANV